MCSKTHYVFNICLVLLVSMNSRSSCMFNIPQFPVSIYPAVIFINRIVKGYVYHLVFIYY